MYCYPQLSKTPPTMTRSSLKRDSNDRIKIFDRDEWLLKRQQQKTTKLLDLKPEFQKAKDKLSLGDPIVCSTNKNYTSVVDRSADTYNTRCNVVNDMNDDASVNSNAHRSKPVDITSKICKDDSSKTGEVRIQQKSFCN